MFSLVAPRILRPKTLKEVLHYDKEHDRLKRSEQGRYGQLRFRERPQYVQGK
jgi:hypothetical protein